MTILKAFLLAAVVSTTFLTTGCTMTLGEHSLTLTPPANPGQRENLPQTTGASLAYDDHPSRGR
jgi:hypothetical protein